MTHISLFSGIGGIDLAAEWAGFRTIAQVERDSYCLKVLEKHWPNVHRCREIREFPDQDYEPVTLVSGGFPCQPFSTVGKRRGKEDDRFLWPEMLRVIREIQPSWVLAENVSGLLSIESGMVFESVLTNLEAEGYETWTGLIPAAGAGAPHYRYRVFIVAYSEKWESGKSQTWNGGQGISRRSEDVEHPQGQRGREESDQECVISASQDVADTASPRRRPTGTAGQTISQPGKKQRSSGCYSDYKQWAVEPDVGRVASGIPHRVDRLRALGNACVPQVILPILQAIAYTEQHENDQVDEGLRNEG